MHIHDRSSPIESAPYPCGCVKWQAFLACGMVFQTSWGQRRWFLCGLAAQRQGGDLLNKATACSGSRRLITKIGEFVLTYSSWIRGELYFFLSPLPLAHSPGNLNAKAVLDESSASMAIELSGIWASHGCQWVRWKQSMNRKPSESLTPVPFQ